MTANEQIAKGYAGHYGTPENGVGICVWDGVHNYKKAPPLEGFVVDHIGGVSRPPLISQHGYIVVRLLKGKGLVLQVEDVEDGLQVMEELCRDDDIIQVILWAENSKVAHDLTVEVAMRSKEDVVLN